LEVTKQFSITDKLISRGMGEVAPIIINGIEDKSLSRRIKIKFEL
jgi:outer membrane protein OmpA-like peptidoglycan-associated protein